MRGIETRGTWGPEIVPFSGLHSRSDWRVGFVLRQLSGIVHLGASGAGCCQGAGSPSKVSCIA